MGIPCGQAGVTSQGFLGHKSVEPREMDALILLLRWVGLFPGHSTGRGGQVVSSFYAEVWFPTAHPPCGSKGILGDPPHPRD